jgi:hypothetical protein
LLRQSPHRRVTTSSGMKHLRWVPLAFLAGQHGFAIFAPYAALMLMIDHLMNRRRRPQSVRAQFN